MSKGLEALKDIRSWFSCHDYDQHNEMNIIEKELKALEIIKSIKGLIEEEDLFYDNEENTYYFFGNKIAKEDYDLLKEVLL